MRATPKGARSIPKVALFLQGVRHYERELLRGISDYANLHGPWQFQRNVSYLTDREVDPVELIERWQPDAVILRESRPHRYDEILHTGRPTVYSPTTECRAGIPNIVVNDPATGRIAADHLHEAGFRHFGYCGVRAFFWSRRRGEGFGQRVEDHGHEAHLFDSDDGREFFSWDAGHQRLIDWLLGLPKPVGIFCCTDDFTLLVQEACVAVGLRIPDEVALIGVGDDESICELAQVSQSSVRLNIRRGGYDAARHLARCLQGKGGPRRPDDIVIEPLGVRARPSTDATETLDPEVAKAVSFIRERVNTPIEVDDVIRVVNLSRRRLYDRFREATGKSIYAYIRDRRLENFARLLLETSLTVSEVAYAMGEKSDNNVARLFKKHFGMTPVAYRRKHARPIKHGE
ncbi:substrate-binding domain-containing protein [Haloferula sp. A504]|uniref:AraC family transcriptional regulator n=1 Tax=Haloferula sp. A504 TaxID=3373601 RepID=UPI0031BFB730|nr:DNA-binding transcriptional regulator [Verrucomicrobiaceae bacterium E54]